MREETGRSASPAPRGSEASEPPRGGSADPPPSSSEPATGAPGDPPRQPALDGSAATSIEVEPGYTFTELEILGDIDGDGVDDFLLSAMAMTEDVLQVSVPSASYLFYGRSDLPPIIEATSADAVLRGTEVWLGGITSGAPPRGAVGDLNGDGLDDFVVASGGALHFVFGSEQRLSREHAVADVATASWSFTPVESPIGMVAAPTLVVPAGDVQGDAVSDFTLTVQSGGFNAQTPNGTSLGPARITYLVTGHDGAWPSGDFDPAWATAIFTTPDGVPACLVSATADLDGDGNMDLVLSSGGPQRLVQGSPALAGTMLATEVGTPFAARYGWLTRLPDLDGDGSDELAWKDFAGLPSTYVSYGGAALVAQLSLRPDIDVGGDGLHVTGIGAADLDADGIKDLIVTAAGVPILAVALPGGLYVVSGREARLSGTLALSDQYLVVSGDAGDADRDHPTGTFDGALDASGDVTGDGVVDILAATSTMTSDNRTNARVMLVPGGRVRRE